MSLLPQLPTVSLPPFALIPAPSSGPRRRFTDGSFKGYVFHVTNPSADRPHGVNSTTRTIERRIQIIHRPRRNGGNLNDFGGSAKVYGCEIEFHGPNYLSEFAKFQAVCEEGTPGVLILPDKPEAVLACLHRLSLSSSAQEGETIRVQAEWIEEGSEPQPDNSSAGLSAENQLQKNLDNAGGALGKIAQAGSSLQSVMQNNVFINGVKNVYGKISQVRSAVNSVLRTTNADRKAILDAVGTITATIDLANLVGDRVLSMLGVRADRVLGTSRASSPAPAPTSSFTGTPIATAVDPDTGQQIADFREPDTVAPPADPLAPPSVVPAVAESVPEIQTTAGAEASIQELIDTLTDAADEIASVSDGRTDDVTRAVHVMNNALRELATAAHQEDFTPYLVPVEMSLAEVLFFNGISVDLMDEALRNNTHLDNPLAITAGTVVYL